MQSSTYKCSQSSFQWFISYLESRQQTIEYGHGTSLLSFIKSGVPQGSILEPLLFLFFIYDLPLLLKHCFSDFFADDSTIHSSAPSIAKINKELQADLEIAVAWSKQNKLPNNHDKTTCMFNNIIQNFASQTHLDIRTPKYSKYILSKL